MPTPGHDGPPAAAPAPRGVALAAAPAPRGVALAAIAALIYLVLGAGLMNSALFGDDVVSPAAFWAQNGPFPATLRSRVPPGIDLLSDNVTQFTPWLRYAADSWARERTIPLWKSLAFCGAPLVGNGQSALFFPTNLAAVLLGAPAWFGTAQTLFKLVAGALGAFALARHLRLSFPAALLAGFVFGFGGFQVVFLQHPHTLVSLLLPLLLLCADRLVLAPSAGAVAALALVAGLQHLGGHSETAVHCQAAALALGLARAWSLRRHPGATTGRRLGSLAGALALGAVLGAIQIVPQLEYIAASDGLRLRTLRAAASAAPALSALLGFAAALVLAVLCAAHVARGRAWLWISALGLALATGAGLLAGLAGGLSPTWIALLCADWFGTVDNMLGPVNYVELNGAFAGAALPLALLGLLAGARRAHGARVCPRRGVAADEPAAADPAAGAVIAAGILALVGTLALYRAPGLTDVLGLLPGLRLAENTRLSLLALLGIAVLAGFGLDAIGRAPRVPRLRLRFALLLGALLLGAWGALAYAVHGGRIVLDDGRQRDDGIVLHALPVDEACALLHPSLAARAAAGMSFDAEPHRVFAGWFASPPGTAPPRLPGTAADTADGGAAASAPVARAIGGRLIYSRAGRSVEALVTSALRRGDPATPWLGARGAPLCVFVAAVPERELPPGSPPVRLRLSFDDGRVLFTSPSSAPDAGATPLPFPAQPAFGDAFGQLALLLLAALALLALLDARGAARGGARAALLVLCGASLLPFAAHMVPLLPEWAFYPRSDATDALAGLGPEARVLVKEGPDMPSEIAVAYGIRDVRGYDALSPADTAALLRRATDHPPWTSSIGALPTIADLRLPLLGAMGVRCIADWNDAPPALGRIAFPGENKLPAWAPFRMVLNPFFLPRARLVAGRVVEPDTERALDALAAPDFPHATTVIVEGGAPAPAAAEGPGDAHITLDRPDQVAIAVTPSRPCLLVLADTFYPGWKAFVDGAPRPILRADVAFRAVELVPGDAQVEFRYEPLSFRLGAAASAAGSVALLLLAWAGARSRPRHGMSGIASAAATRAADLRE